MGKMSREDLFREIGEIDEIYVEEAQKVRRKRRISPWAGKTLVTAASLLLCVGVGYVALSLTRGGINNADGTSGGAMEAAQEMYSMAEAGDQTAAGAVPEAPGEQVNRSENQAEDMEKQDILLDVITEEESGMDRSSEDLQQELKEDEVEEFRESINVEGENSDMDNGEVQGAIQESASTMAETSKLMWEAARMDAAYGRYVDVQVPEGYSYTSGTRSASGLYVIWNKGMEEISISCRQADESVSDWLVDVDIPEEYDLGLYSIPWSDSVPGELIQKVYNAAFRPDQITREIVAARSHQVQEQGDAGVWRTRIAVLYSDNVLVEISSKGPSPEEIYELIYLEN